MPHDPVRVLTLHVVTSIVRSFESVAYEKCCGSGSSQRMKPP